MRRVISNLGTLLECFFCYILAWLLMLLSPIWLPVVIAKKIYQWAEAEEEADNDK